MGATPIGERFSSLRWPGGSPTDGGELPTVIGCTGVCTVGRAGRMVSDLGLMWVLNGVTCASVACRFGDEDSSSSLPALRRRPMKLGSSGNLDRSWTERLFSCRLLTARSGDEAGRGIWDWRALCLETRP